MKLNKETILKKLSEVDVLLSPNQEALSLPIISRISKKMKYGIKFRPIHTSSQGIIVDGHHRYIASILVNYEIQQIPNYPQPSILNDLTWNLVNFVEDDWDSQSKITMLNALDARYNNIDISDIEQIIGSS